MSHEANQQQGEQEMTYPKVEITYTIENLNFYGDKVLVVTETWLDHTSTTSHRFVSKEAVYGFINSHPLLSII
jgi:hypothetical protein